MEIRTALALSIGQLGQPVVTAYQLGRSIFQFYLTKTYKGEHLRKITKNYPNRQDYNRLTNLLLKAGVLQQSKNIHNPQIYTVLGATQELSREMACSVDPFAYISHMSAMEWHGITDKNPRTLFISSPAPTDWKKFAHKKMEKDLGDSNSFTEYLHTGLPQLQRLNFTKIGRETVHRYASQHLGAFVAVKNRPLRISTIGRTFLDMVREPDLCGGIYHVLDVYQEFSERYLPLIADEIDRHGTKIEKVRVGYILEERLGLHHKNIDKWIKFAQRGGSRKLYAQHEYSPNFSERWCLSLNIEE